MPRPLTKQEKAVVIDNMYKNGLLLIRTKKLKNITVEDITTASGIAKGTFYVYYKTKEEFMYEIIKKFEIDLMDNIIVAASDNADLKSKVVYIFKNLYLSSNSIAFSLTPEDVEWLLSKLPEKKVPEQEKAQNNFVLMFEALGIPTSKCTSTTIHYLADCLLHISSSSQVYNDEIGKQEALDIMINTIADYVCTLAQV